MITCYNCYKPLPKSGHTAGCCKCDKPCPNGISLVNCITYGLHDQESNSELICLGVPRNTSLLTILLQIQNKILNRVKPLDTNSVDLKFVCGVLSANVRLDPTSSLPVSVTSMGIKFDCCPFDCTNVTYDLNAEVTTVNRASSHYTRLLPNQFTLSDTITSVQFLDYSTLIGDDLLYLNYIDLFDGGTATITSLGDPFTITNTFCAASVLGSQKQFVWEMSTNRGCFFTKICNIYIERVNYSERLAFGYRSNYQINDMPLMPTPGVDPTFDKGVLYFNDVRFLNTSESKGGLVRKMFLNTASNESCEIRTIAGSQKVSTPITLHNVWGDEVGYDYNSSIVLDRNEISYNEPAIYFATFGGVVCRLVKERDTECDERANWKNYVIAGANDVSVNIPNVTGTTVDGSTARFRFPYTLKRWYDINNMPSFLLKVTPGVMLVWYKGGFLGGANNPMNWAVVNTGINIQGNNAIINVEDSPLATETGKKRIWVLQQGDSVIPSVRVITFPFAAPTEAQLTNSANYTNSRTVIAMGHPTSNIVGNGAVSAILEPLQITRINTNTGYHYLLTTLYLGFNAVSTSNSSCNGDLIRIDEGANPTTASDYTISKVIDYSVNPNLLNSTIGAFGSGANSKLVYGMFSDLKNNHYDHCLGGMRRLDFANNQFSGFLAGNADPLDTSIPDADPYYPLGLKDVDSLYHHVLDCNGVNCNKPLFQLVQLSNTSFTIVITNYNPLLSYDLSIDGGISFVQMGITNPYTFTPVVPGATYQVVVRVQCGIDYSLLSDPLTVIIPNDEVRCDNHSFLITNVTQNGFIVNVQNPVFGHLYSVSIDAGLSYIVNNVATPNIPISGLTPNTTYQVLVKIQYPDGLLCYALGQTVKTLMETTYCIEITETVVGTSHTVTATLKDNLGNPIPAGSNLNVPFKMNNGTGPVSSHSVTIIAGTPSATTVVTSANSNFVCTDSADWVGCSIYNITNPCPCDPNPCPCNYCVDFEGDTETKRVTFFLRDCFGDIVIPQTNVVVTFLCAGQIFTATIPAGSSSSAPTQYNGCDPNSVVIQFTTPSYNPCDPALFL